MWGSDSLFDGAARREPVLPSTLSLSAFICRLCRPDGLEESIEGATDNRQTDRSYDMYVIQE
jgi:hypothetical protein